MLAPLVKSIPNLLVGPLLCQSLTQGSSEQTWLEQECLSQLAHSVSSDLHSHQPTQGMVLQNRKGNPAVRQRGPAITEGPQLACHLNSESAHVSQGGRRQGPSCSAGWRHIATHVGRCVSFRCTICHSLVSLFSLWWTSQLQSQSWTHVQRPLCWML